MREFLSWRFMHGKWDAEAEERAVHAQVAGIGGGGGGG